MNVYLGFISIIFGILIIIHPKFSYPKFMYYFDLTDARWPFGLVFIIFGIFYLWVTIRKRK